MFTFTSAVKPFLESTSNTYVMFAVLQKNSLCTWQTPTSCCKAWVCVFLEAAEIQDALTPDIQESTSTLLKDPPANTEPDRSGDLKILQSENFITRDCLTYLP